MKYSRIESERDLQALDEGVCWEDSTLVTCFMSGSHQSSFPTDVAYSGRHQLNLHCLYDVCSAPASHLEIVFIGCEDASLGFISEFYPRGRVLKNGNVEFRSFDGGLNLRCAAVIHRFIELGESTAQEHFLRPGILDYPSGELQREGVLCIQGTDAEIVVAMNKGRVVLTVVDAAGTSARAALDRTQTAELADALCQALSTIPGRSEDQQ